MARNYTKEEDAIICKCISENPGNIQQACVTASKLLRSNLRTPIAISQRWYAILSKKPDVSFMVYSKRSTALLNKKQTITVSETPTHSKKQTFWDKVVNFIVFPYSRHH